MTTNYRTRNSLLLAKAQAAIGTEETPTVGSNAVKVRTPIGFSPRFDALQTDFVQGSLSQSAPIVGGGMVSMALGALLKGSGSGGTAPDWGVLARACGLSETLTASAVTGTAQAGASGSITLASGASSTNNAYRGMPIRITSGTGSGQTNIIASYVGSTKVATVGVTWAVTPDNTSVYSIDANALYRPISQGVEVATIWAYQLNDAAAGQARRRSMMDAAGSMRLSVSPRGLGQLDFSMMGKLSRTPDDVSAPSAPTYQTSEPPPLLSAKAYLGGAAVQFSELSFDLGGDVQMFDDPSAAYGYDAASLMARVPTGRIVPNLVAVSSRDAFSDWLAGTSRALWLSWGSTNGNRISLYMPQCRYQGNEAGDVRGFATEGIPFRSIETDAEIFLACW